MIDDFRSSSPDYINDPMYNNMPCNVMYDHDADLPNLFENDSSSVIRKHLTPEELKAEKKTATIILSVVGSTILLIALSLISH